MVKHSEILRVLGLMTGSSADGLDICLVEFKGNGLTPEFKILYSSEIPYPTHFREAFINPLHLTDDHIYNFDTELGMWFATEIKKLDLRFDLIASHGQTVKHNPPYSTLQIGEPSYMAEMFNVPVIYDFRTADLKQGGQGAPLIPIVDRLLYQHATKDQLSLNIGGIANLTIIPAENNPSDLLAWDTGPGNTLIDKAVRLYTRGKFNFDPEGSFAAHGILNNKLLRFLLKHEFYSLKPPRSAGQEQFGNLYFQRILKQFYPTTDQQYKDLILTLTELTAITIANSLNHLHPTYSPTTIHIGGGGLHNVTLMNTIQTHIPEITIHEVDTNGINANNKEAFGFAYLGYLHAHRIPGNIPSVTGAQNPTVLGITCLPTHS